MSTHMVWHAIACSLQLEGYALLFSVQSYRRRLKWFCTQWAFGNSEASPGFVFASRVQMFATGLCCLLGRPWKTWN